jgi:hypothetical protein
MTVQSETKIARSGVELEMRHLPRRHEPIGSWWHAPTFDVTRRSVSRLCPDLADIHPA